LARPLLVLVAGLLTLCGGLSGCVVVPDTPDAGDWDRLAAQAVEDNASEVATVRLVLREQQRERLLGRYGVVTAVAAEEAAAKATDSVTTVQPPPARRQADQRVADLLARAGDLVTEARVALVDGDASAFPRLVDDLAEVHDQLQREHARLSAS
jgi:DNA primase